MKAIPKKEFNLLFLVKHQGDFHAQYKSNKGKRISKRSSTGSHK